MAKKHVHTERPSLQVSENLLLLIDDYCDTLGLHRSEFIRLATLNFMRDNLPIAQRIRDLLDQMEEEIGHD